MKLLVNENFQFRGMHRAGSTITVSDKMLKAEVAKGKHPKVKKMGRSPWLSGLLEHCIPANTETSDFLAKLTGKAVKPAVKDEDKKDDSAEIAEIRAEFDKLGKAYNPRWQVKRLRNEIIKARKMAGEQEDQSGAGESEEI